MPFSVRSNPGESVALKLYNGATQFGGSIVAVESTTLPGYYTAPYPAGLPPGEYRIEGLADGIPIVPIQFFWDGAAEITLFSLLVAIQQISTGGGGGLTTQQAELLQEARDFSRIAKDGVVGRFVKSAAQNTGTLYGSEGQVVVLFDLRDRNNAASVDDVFSRIPR